MVIKEIANLYQFGYRADIPIEDAGSLEER